MGFRYWKWGFTAGGAAIMLDELELLVDGVDVARNKSIWANGQTHSPVTNLNNNGALGSQWQNNQVYPHWVVIDTGVIPYAPESYRFRASYQLVFNPTAWTFYGSNDNSTWVPIHSVSGVTWPSAYEWKSWEVAWQQIAGVTLDSLAAPISRTVRAYLRDTGEFLGGTQSSAVTGEYSIAVFNAGEIQVVMLDDAAGTLENDLITRTVPA